MFAKLINIHLQKSLALITIPQEIYLQLLVKKSVKIRSIRSLRWWQ